MLEDLKRSEANRKAHVCPEQPLAHLFSNSTPAMTGQVMRPDYEAMARSTDKRDQLNEVGCIF